jgi:peptide/nickel transport system ATP-binding protein
VSDDPLLAVRDLEKHYPVRSGLFRRVTGHVKAVDGVSFTVHEGETVGLVGESGCGKSTTATTALGLEEPTGGAVYFDGDRVGELSGADRRAFRRRAQVVFQDPNTAFDPQMTVAESVAEPLAIHGLSDADRRRAIAVDLLERLGLSAADADRYPRSLSGGQKRRVALARALVLDPDLLVADEPVSGLDVSVQADVLGLIDALADAGLGVVLVSHDLGVVRQVCDRVCVMYLGEVVERGPTEALFRDPAHPYTRALLGSIPAPDPRARGEGPDLAGEVPDPSNPPAGCSFHPRCPAVIPPEEYDLEDDSYRALVDLRLALADGDLDPGDHADAAAVREAFGLPDGLADDDAEERLASALAALQSGDLDGARDRLEAFESVCEREAPALRETAAGHVAACHRHDPPAADGGDRPGEAVAPGHGERGEGE